MENQETNQVEQTQEMAVPETEEKLPEQKPEGTEKYKYDMLRYKEEVARERQARLALEQKLKQEEMSKLEREKNHEELARVWKQKYEEVEQKYSGVISSQVDYFKKTAVENELVKLGIKSEYLSLAKKELDDAGIVDVETTSMGNINVIGAREFAETFKNKYPDVFKVLGRPAVNTQTPSMNTGKVWKAEEILALEKGDPVEYKKALGEYLKQKTR